mmetsp:Transcript_70131/g.168111  ORF Transcript_70131/g.168111 Transcript_70131/m.168111 type:complete len:182 (+) Transcript_70131:86-631(+)
MAIAALTVAMVVAVAVCYSMLVESTEEIAGSCFSQGLRGSTLPLLSLRLLLSVSGGELDDLTGGIPLSQAAVGLDDAKYVSATGLNLLRLGGVPTQTGCLPCNAAQYKPHKQRAPSTPPTTATGMTHIGTSALSSPAGAATCLSEEVEVALDGVVELLVRLVLVLRVVELVSVDADVEEVL